MQPKARSASFDTTQLSPLAAFAFVNADGTRSVDDLAALAATNGQTSWTRESVFQALDELADLGLLEGRVAPPAGRPKNRRATAAVASSLGLEAGLPLAMHDHDKDDDKPGSSKRGGHGPEDTARKNEHSDKKTAEETARNNEHSDKKTSGARSNEHSDKTA